MATPDRASRLPWIFVAAMGVVVLVNAVMVTAALRTHSGLAHGDAFGRGLAYNAVLDAAERRDRLGWRLTVQLGGAGTDGRRLVEIGLVDSDGAPLPGGAVAASFVRPVEAMAPLAARFEETAPGRYAAGIELPAAGQWDMRIDVARGGERLQFVQRVFAR
jgi:nitrogen fixation protein FixH